MTIRHDESTRLRPLPTDAAEPPWFLHFVPWPDPVIESLGHHPSSYYVEHFWLPILGPTSTWLIRRLAGHFEATDLRDGFVLDATDTARALGLGARHGRNSPFGRALSRCVTFEMVRWQGPSRLAVRRALPPLPRRHLLRLPPTLRELHEARSQPGPALSVLEQQRRRARELALCVLDRAPDPNGAALAVHLMRSGVHPAVAHEAAAWAVALRSKAAGPDASRACLPPETRRS